MPDVQTRTVRDVELLKVGTWQASTGEFTITREDLESAVEPHAPALCGRRR
jgi:DNA repair photolyase